MAAGHGTSRCLPKAAATWRCRCATSISAAAWRTTGRVVVDLASNQVGVDIRQQGQNLVVEFLRTSLPEGLRRRLDVADFGTPVQTITTTRRATGCAW
jgi:type II secretory pathway component HofQ